MEATQTPPTVYYKGMLEDGLTKYGRPGWHLPKGSRPGKWMPKVEVRMCDSGYHVCTIDQLRTWIAPAIYVVEVRGDHVEDMSKSAWAQARLVRRIEGWGIAEMVEWAQRCAGHVNNLKNAFYAATYASGAAAYASSAPTAAASYAASAATAAASAATAECQWQTGLLISMLQIERGST
jgi:hypothetical protein